MRKAIVISNCQCLPLASTLSRILKGIVFDFFGVHIIPPEKKDNTITEFVKNCNKNYDFVLSIPLGSEYNELSNDAIGSSLDIRVIKISNIYFSGLHPDLTYIGGLSQRIVGPLGDYHSKLALFSFVNRLSLSECVNLFNNETYRKLGYYSEYDNSYRELTKRDEGVDVPVTKILKQLLREKMCFLSVNHPTIDLFLAYGVQIANFLEESGLAKRSSAITNVNIFNENLAQGPIFPVYNEIAEHHNVPQLGSYEFKPTGSFVNGINLGEFLNAEYDAFSTVNFDALANSYAMHQINRQFSEFKQDI